MATLNMNVSGGRENCSDVRYSYCQGLQANPLFFHQISHTCTPVGFSGLGHYEHPETREGKEMHWFLICL